MKDVKKQYGSSNVLVRVYEKNLLEPEYFDRIINADNYEEVRQILDETYYHKFIEEMTDESIEEGQTKVLLDAYEKIFEISPSKELSEYVSLRYTYHNIKLAFKENITGENLKDLYFPISPFSHSAIEYAVSSGKSSRIPKQYLENINDVRVEYEEYHNLYAIDVMMDRHYLAHLLLLANEINDDLLIDYTERVIDYRNFITLLRAMRQERTRNFLNAVLSDSEKIPKEDLIELAHKDFSEVIRYYNRTYMDKIVSTINGDTLESLNMNRLEALIEDEMMSFLHQGKRIASGPMPIVAFLHAKEVEVKNLRILSFTKGINLEADQIRERMRLNYVT